MRIWVDADACPVKGEVLEAAKAFSLPVTMVCDTSHELRGYPCEVLTVDRHSDSSDLAIINRAERGDVLVTQDFGLAALALGKGLYAMRQDGMEYTPENIDELLFTRSLSGKLRRAGRRTGGPKKRSREEDRRFAEGFTALLRRVTTE